MKKHKLSLSQEEFLKRMNIVFGNFYDFSESVYINLLTKVKCICPKHGEFWSRPDHLMNGHGCPKCAIEKKANKERLTIEEVKSRIDKVFNKKYDTSKIQYKNLYEKITLICPIHGEFEQTPYNHTLQQQGCPQCACESNAIKITKDTEWFLEKARIIHGDRYDYSETVYTKAKEKLCVICHEKDDGGYEHGRFWLTPHAHLSHSGGCPKCGHPKHTIEWFVKRAQTAHGDTYDYSQAVYENNHTPLTVICPDHGPFTIFPSSHLRGAGCPKCAGRNLT